MLIYFVMDICGCRVFVVDDNVLVCEVIGVMFEVFSFSV